MSAKRHQRLDVSLPAPLQHRFFIVCFGFITVLVVVSQVGSHFDPGRNLFFLINLCSLGSYSLLDMQGIAHSSASIYFRFSASSKNLFHVPLPVVSSFPFSIHHLLDSLPCFLCAPFLSWSSFFFLYWLKNLLHMSTKLL